MGGSCGVGGGGSGSDGNGNSNVSHSSNSRNTCAHNIGAGDRESNTCFKVVATQDSRMLFLCLVSSRVAKARF